MSNKIQAVIFDMDGLMFDTEHLWIKVATKLSKKYGYYQIDKNFVVNNLGTTVVDIKKSFEKLNIPNFNFEKFRGEYIDGMLEDIELNGIPIKKGLLQLLVYLKQNGYKTALASSTYRPLIDKYILPIGIEQYFDVIVSGDLVTHGKPDPEIFNLAVTKLGVQKQNTVILEDSFNGIRAAYASGCKPVMIPDILQPNEEIKPMLHKKYKSLLAFLSALKNEEV